MTHDPEAVGIAALRSRPAVAALVAGRVSTRLSGTYPALRVTLTAGARRPVTGTARPVLQIEAWGENAGPAGEAQASDLIRTVENETEAGSLAGSYAAGAVVACWVETVPFHSPDINRERYIMQLGLLVQANG